MTFALQLNDSGSTQTRWNFDNTSDSLNGVTPQTLGYTAAPFNRIAYDRIGNAAYMVFGTKLWRGRLAGVPNVDLLWNQKPLANGEDFVDTTTGKHLGSLDTCGCKVAAASYEGYDRKVSIYNIDSDSFETILVDDSENYFPIFSCLAYGEDEDIYVEFTSNSYEEQLFFVIHNDGEIRRLADPLDGAGVSLVYADGKIFRLDNVAGLSYYDPDADTWTNSSVNLGVSESLHYVSENELVAIATGNLLAGSNKIYSYNIDTDTVTTPYLTTSPQSAGGAAFIYREPTDDIDFTKAELTLCICILLTRADGTEMGFTTHDRQITIDSINYVPIDAMQSTAVRHELGTGIDNLDVEGLLNPTIISSSYITETELRAGIYDNARVQMFFCDWLFPTKTIENIIIGTTGEVQIMQGKYVAEVRGLMQRMAQQIGELTSPTCRVKKLGDARCTVDLTPFRHSSSVATVQGPRLISFNDTQITGYYDYGIVEFTSGDNEGLSREIKNNVFNSGTGDNDIALQEAFPFQIQVGDTCILEAGCDRRKRTCIDKFDNIVNFRGEPYVPGTDQITKVGRLI